MMCLSLRLFLFSLTIIYVKASNEVLEFTGGTFECPNEEKCLLWKSTGRYISKNMLVPRAQIYNDDIFAALTRYKPGTVATLAKLIKKPRACEATLTAFPNWETQDEEDCEGLQSVVDLFADKHGFLWVLDSGIITTLDNPTRKNPPKVVIFNVQTGKKVKTLDLSGLVVPATRTQFIVVEYTPEGNVFAYVTDASTRSILVFDVTGGKCYRFMLPKCVAGSRRDVLYTNLVRKECGNNFLIITYLSGARIFAIRTDHLRSGSATGKIQDCGPKDGKLVLLGTDDGAAVFYRHEGKSEVYRWDSNSNVFCKGDLVYKPDNGCYLATQVMPDHKRGKMLVLESNFLDFFEGNVGCGVSHRISPMISYV